MSSYIVTLLFLHAANTYVILLWTVPMQNDDLSASSLLDEQCRLELLASAPTVLDSWTVYGMLNVAGPACTGCDSLRYKYKFGLIERSLQIIQGH